MKSSLRDVLNSDVKSTRCILLAGLLCITMLSSGMLYEVEAHPVGNDVIDVDIDVVTGMVFTDNKFWVLSRDDGKVFVYNSNNTRATNFDFELHPDNNEPYGLAHLDGKFWITNQDLRDSNSVDKVFAYNIDGTRAHSLDFEFGLESTELDNFYSTDITFANGKFWILDQGETKVYAYNADGIRANESDFEMHEGRNALFTNSSPGAIVFANDKFWVLEWRANKIYAYNADGTHADGFDFDVNDDLTNTLKMATDGEHLWIYDYQNDTITAFDIPTEKIPPKPTRIIGTVSADGSNLSNVTIALRSDDGVIDTTLTDNNGNYEFTNLEPDTDIVISVILPNGYIATSHASYITSLYPEETRTLNFTLTRTSDTPDTATFTGGVFSDENGNGVWDDGEGLTARVFVEGTNLSTESHEISGYRLNDVPPGIQTISIDMPEGYTGDSSFTYVIYGGQSIRVDFALTPQTETPGTISGVIFSDINNNDTQDAGEMGIPNVIISINSLTDTTDDVGAYSIDMIPPGTHTISFDMPDGYTGTSTQDITISSGNNELNFAIYPVPITTGGIAGNIFSDDDSNDIRGQFEVGISTDISLVGTNYSTTSKPNGNYSFLNIPVGEYQVRVTPPSGYSIDVDTKSVTISGDYTSTVNFAMTPDPISPDSTTIYGVVFSDTNWNGIQDEGESGIANYTMMAIYGQELLHDITDNDGRYSIDVSPRVSYHVRTQFFPAGACSI